MGWLITFAILAALGSIPLGVYVRYDSSGPKVQIVAGSIHYSLIPARKRKRTSGKEKKKKQAGQDDRSAPEPVCQSAPVQAQTDAALPSEDAKQEKGGSVADFVPLVKLALKFLNQFRKKLRVDDLVLKVTLAGDDPCDLAVNYGRAWAAVGNFIPVLERTVRLGKRNIEVLCDFSSEQTVVVAQAKLTVRLGKLLYMGAVYGFLFIKEFLNFRKKRKGGSIE